VVFVLKPRLHDASWFARSNTRWCGCRRFVQVVESSTGSNLKRVVTSITLNCTECQRTHPLHLTRASQLASCQDTALAVTRYNLRRIWVELVCWLRCESGSSQTSCKKCIYQMLGGEIVCPSACFVPQEMWYWRSSLELIWLI